MKIIDRENQKLTEGKFAQLNVQTRQTQLTGTQTNTKNKPNQKTTTTRGAAPATKNTGKPSNTSKTKTPKSEALRNTKPGTKSRITRLHQKTSQGAAATQNTYKTLTTQERTDTEHATKATDTITKTGIRGGKQIRRATSHIRRRQKAQKTRELTAKTIKGAPKTASITHRLGMRAVNLANVTTAALKRALTAITLKLAGTSGPLILLIAVILTALILVLSLLPGWLVNHIATTESGEQVPAEYAEIVQRAGNICEEVPPNLIAGIIEQESNWDQNVISSAGAVGIAQFMPQWWPSQGKRAANDGQPADINNPHDQIWSLGNDMCENFRLARTYLDQGWVTGTELELALAIYNAGQGNVIRYGGVPPFVETQNYVVQVPQKAMKYLGTGIGNTNETITADGTAITTEARKYLGATYVWGGETPTGLDCSGLVTITFRALGIEIPHHANTAANSNQGTIIPPGQWQPGDVLYFRHHNSATYHHTGIYSGNGNLIEAVTFGIPLREGPVPTTMAILTKRYH